MMLFSITLLIATAFSTVAWAQTQSAWGQCGGSGWKGPTTCVPGYHCNYVNYWYSQCVPVCAGTTLYTTSGVVGTGVTLIPTVTTVKPYASATTVTRLACASIRPDGYCAYSATTTWRAIWDFFATQTLTVTITKPVSGTLVTSIPVATTTLPCYKREYLEERDRMREREAAEKREELKEREVVEAE